MRRCVYPALFVQASPSSSKPLERYPVNIRVGKASSGHWGGTKRRWERAGGDTHPKCAQHKENPSCSGAPSGIRMLSSQEFPGKIQRRTPGLEKPFPRDKVGPPPGVFAHMHPHPCSVFCPLLVSNTGFFPFGKNEKGVFSPVAAQWKQSRSSNRATQKPRFVFPSLFRAI